METNLNRRRPKSDFTRARRSERRAAGKTAPEGCQGGWQTPIQRRRVEVVKCGGASMIFVRVCDECRAVWASE